MLEIRNVVKTFGKGLSAVDGVSLELKGGVVGPIGHNGAGNTALMQMIATLTRPTSGQILFRGDDIAVRPDAIRRRLGYLPQDFGVCPNQHEQARRPAAALSGGMRRRLGIAQALLAEPDILIVDGR
jgi:ABC-2 type transport system ATP-binding protein